MKHKLLLIGDSIRQSYQPHVAALLSGICDVAGVDINTNCRDTRTTLGLFDDANDLNSIISKKPKSYIKTDGVHFNSHGESVVAKTVVSAVLSLL